MLELVTSSITSGLAYHKLFTHLNDKSQDNEEDESEEHDEGVNMTNYFMHMFDKLKELGTFPPSPSHALTLPLECVVTVYPLLEKMGPIALHVAAFIQNLATRGEKGKSQNTLTGAAHTKKNLMKNNWC